MQAKINRGIKKAKSCLKFYSRFIIKLLEIVRKISQATKIHS